MSSLSQEILQKESPSFGKSGKTITDKEIRDASLFMNTLSFRDCFKTPEKPSKCNKSNVNGIFGMIWINA
jgi:hypothetical protein